MSDASPPHRREGDHFGVNYVIDRLEKAVENLGNKIDAMATKVEVGIAFTKIDQKADAADLEKIDTRLIRIERNQLPPWSIGVATICVTVGLAVVLHFWK